MSVEFFRNYINGEYVDGDSYENRNPANTDEVVGLFGKATAADVAKAAEAAQAAFPGWANMAAPARGALLFKVADILEKKFDQLGAEMTREEGKTLPEAKGEVRRSINILRYFAGEGARMPGMLVPSERDRVHMFALRKPIGVAGLVTPWNFPSAIPTWKLAPALICGNTVVLKPASAAPLSAWRIVDTAMEISGGFGMFKKNELERLFRDARAGRFHPANAALAHEIIGKLTLGINPDEQPRWG